MAAGAAFAQVRSDLALENYTAALARNYPLAYRRYLSELPPGVNSLAWLRHLDGDTSGPIRSVTVEGRTMLYGFACVPHDCGPNSLDLLFSADQSRVVGMLKLENAAGLDSEAVFGEPTPAELACLQDPPDRVGAPAAC